MQTTQPTYTVNHKGCAFSIPAKLRTAGNDMLFFIHGLGCAKETFDGVWSFRKLDRFSILACDLPGFGGSPGCSGYSYDMRDTAELCRLLIDQFAGYRIHIIGHSMGGAVGVLLAELIKGRCASFVNVEGNLIGQDCSISSRQSTAGFDEFKKKRLPDILLFSEMSPEPGRRLWAKLMRQSDIEALYRSSRSLVKWSDSGQLLNMFLHMEINKTYVYGDADSSMRVLRLLDGIPLVKISRSGHFPMIDNPGEFYDALATFLGRSVPANQ